MELRSITRHVARRHETATLEFQLGMQDKMKYMLENFCLHSPDTVEYSYTRYGKDWFDSTTLNPAPQDHLLYILLDIIHQYQDVPVCTQQ